MKEELKEGFREQGTWLREEIEALRASSELLRVVRRQNERRKRRR